MNVECFSQRLLNPFRGVMNVIRFEAAEAVTTDGLKWEIYVNNDDVLKGLPTGQYIQTSDIPYGSWTLEDGLRRGPIYPSTDFKRLEEMGAMVYEAVLELHDSIPFGFSDSYELWLLDSGQQPLALLHSVTQPHEVELEMPIQWRAGNHCQKTFTPELDVPVGEDMTAAEMLMLHINMSAGFPLRARWYLRENNGNGEHVATVRSAPDSKDDVTGSTLPASAFAEYFIHEIPDNDDYNRLRAAFIDWQAPWILLLSTLSAEKRLYFEQLARKQALLVDAQYRLYPEIIDEEAIKGARVEAMMRKTHPAEAEKDDALSTWYLELDENERGN